MEGEKLSNEVAVFGFPIEHKHKLCCLRQELIDSFVDSRYMMFIKYAAFHLQQLSMKKKGQETKTTQDANKENEKEKESEKDENEKEEEKEKEKVKEKENEKEKDESVENQIEADVAKKIVESITDGNKQECKWILLKITFSLIII